MIRILIADDQSLFREALRTLLSVQNDFEVIAEACNGEEALRLAVQHHPDVVLMDLRMPVMDGITATRRLHSVLSSCRVIVLTTFDEDEDVLEALRSGAVGYLLKDVTSEKLYEAIRLAARGEYVLHPTITAKVISHIARTTKPVLNESATLVEPLSPREIEILRLVATAASNKEIADQLVIAEGTVKNHMRNILSKLGVRDRLQAVLKAKELGII
ncbi:MAG: response regulator transcription factor [Anaerolineales bacterium]|jgi:DNA-binding NarL/FixJ family response regulator